MSVETWTNPNTNKEYKIGTEGLEHASTGILGGIADIFRTLYPYAKITSAFGADPPAFPLYQPQIALWQATKRTTKAGVRLDSAESISIQKALRIQTMGSAYAGFQEREIGSIETGKLADMVVWDSDYYTVSTDQIKDVKAVMTFVGGKIMYEKRNG